MSKPWLELHSNKSKWWMASMHKNITNKHNKNDIVCYYLMQECNMAGVYHRVFTWYKGDDNRYFHVKSSKNWDFNENFDDFNNDDVVLNKYNKTYKVLVEDKYIKILELVE